MRRALHVIAALILADAVELHTGRPRARDRRTDRRILERPGERSVLHEVDAGMNQQLEFLGDDRLALSPEELVQVALNGFRRAFAPPGALRALLADAESAWQRWAATPIS